MLQTTFTAIMEITLTVSVLIVILLLLYPIINKKYSAKWRYWVWLILAVRLLIPFSPSFPQAPIKITQPEQSIELTVPMQNAAVPQSDENTAPIPQASETPAAPAVSLYEILSVVWITGILLFILYHVTGYYLFRRSASRFSRPVQDEQTLEILHELKEKLDIRQDIRILRCKTVQSPMMTGFLKPILLLPYLEFDRTELTMILNHELIHYKRNDIWYKLLIVIANAVHWFNPLIYIMAAISNKDIEMVCDYEIIKNADMPFRKKYGQTILSAVHKRNLRQLAFSTYFYGGKKVMKERFINIFDMKKKHRGIAAFCILFIAVCTAGGLVACQNAQAATQNKANTSASENTVSLSASATKTASENSSPATEKNNGKESATTTASGTSANYTAKTVSTTSSSQVKIGAVIYNNTKYGFRFLLPESWKGYSIIEDKWIGTDSDNSSKFGPEIIIRHPLWTSNNRLQDIPVMIFTLEEWSSVVKGPSQKEGETLFIGAGPNGPSELGRNSKFVFALPFRYDFSADNGIEEVHDILNLNPLKPTEEMS